VIIRTTLRSNETATLEFHTEIIGVDGARLAKGATTHAFTDMNGLLQFQLPQVLKERLKQLLEWQEGL
jgi:acyl-CoA thioester hydrolase